VLEREEKSELDARLSIDRLAGIPGNLRPASASQKASQRIWMASG
jgi:hypothetical protein